jgi:hypothetical protein
MDIGEGWGSIGRALKEMQEGIRTVGVDRRGHTQTGTQHGMIISEVHHDLADQISTDTITAISKKTGISPSRWDLIWLSPECKLLTTSNAMNQRTGSAHGKWALTDLNRANAAPGRVEQEEQMMEEAMRAIKNQLEALEAHPEIPFALENPAHSQLWEIPEVVSALLNNPDWRRHTVDQCAYGRKAQKPSAILTNIKWEPKGMTGTGRCVTGKCGGTRNNEEGNRKHQEQTITCDKRRRTSMGTVKEGRREMTRDTAVNSVAQDLVQEIMRAAMAEKATRTEKSASNKRGQKRGAQ